MTHQLVVPVILPRLELTSSKRSWWWGTNEELRQLQLLARIVR